VTDGAAAVILTDVQTALGMKQAIAFRAAQHVNDFLPMSKRDIIKFEGPALAWKQALGRGQARPARSLLRREPRLLHLGRADRVRGDGTPAPGEGERAIHEGWVERDGKLPVNVSGGLKAKGHPVGATASACT
jgi:Acetyl-CoA acetyltransferase